MTDTELYGTGSGMVVLPDLQRRNAIKASEIGIALSEATPEEVRIIRERLGLRTRPHNMAEDARPLLEDCARVHDWTLKGVTLWPEGYFLIAAGVCTTPEGDCRLMTVKVKNAV